MHISIDVSSVVYQRGVSFYTSNLVSSIPAILPESDTLSLFGFSYGQYSSLKKFSKTIPAKSRLFPLPQSLSTLALQKCNIPIEILNGSTDVFHTWEWYLPTAIKAKIVITIHDVALFKFDHLSHPTIERQHREVMERIKKYNPTIIAVSESTKHDLIEVCSLSPESIHVVHEALPSEHQLEISSEQLASMKQIYKLEKPYFLMVGTPEPRKNFINQIEAWKEYKSDFDLVLVGGQGWEDIPQESGIIRITNASAFELAALYKGASMLLYCSLYEGFGLPILEAFYYEVPVVTSDSSAMKEIGADAVVLVDPEDVQSIKLGIAKGLEIGTQLIVDGRARLDDFSWNKAAQETYDVYVKAANS